MSIFHDNIINCLFYCPVINHNRNVGILLIKFHTLIIQIMQCLALLYGYATSGKIASREFIVS